MPRVLTRFCECGCHQPTKGPHRRFLKGHNRRGNVCARDPRERFLAMFDAAEGGCWIWQGIRNEKGYGMFVVSKRVPRVRAHRYAYELLVGPIPDGLQIDHLCRNRACVNPAHLEVVTPAENTRRAQPWRVPKTHCVHGHPFDEENTRHTVDPDAQPKRVCRTCVRLNARRYYRARAGSGHV